MDSTREPFRLWPVPHLQAIRHGFHGNTTFSKMTKSHWILLLALLEACASVDSAQTRDLGSAKPQITLKVQVATIHPLEVVSFQVAVRDLSVNFGIVEDYRLTLLDGASESKFLRVVTPDMNVIEHRCLEPTAVACPYDEVVLRPNPGGEIFDLIVGFNFARRTPLFTELGVYRVSLVINGVVSNVLFLECVATSATEKAAMAVVKRMQEKNALDLLYNPYYLLHPHFGTAQPELEEIARLPDSKTFAGMARLVLGTAAAFYATGSRPATEKRKLLSEAQDWLSKITPSSPLSVIAEKEKLRVARLLKQLDGQSPGPMPWSEPPWDRVRSCIP
ncbi:MAG TPA: hypothetical protein EYQ25_04000 [Planctomycetes bacterium]|nr:hypothetical protein [Planctomycetota bacterium]HIL38486.1 hypothetical protein [Planctomycetota bacterium]